MCLLVAWALGGCTSGAPVRAHASTSDVPGVVASPTPSPPAASTCRNDYVSRPLPSWARAGFTPPDQRVPYVLGDRGDIAAVVWVTHEPLVVPPAEDKNNKILWVSRVSSGDPASLRIRAVLTGSGLTATRTVEGGPGPSVIDLPAPGCWSLDLTWGSRHDHLRLEYAAR